jgi:hypothetical protein
LRINQRKGGGAFARWRIYSYSAIIVAIVPFVIRACKIATTLSLQLVVFAVEEVEGIRVYMYNDFEFEFRIRNTYTFYQLGKI